MTAGAAFAPAPGAVTNRGLIRQMESWGWRVKKVSGDDTIMVSPVNHKITVRSAHVHVGTDKYTVNEMLKVMGLTWEEFMRPITEREEYIGQVLRSSDGDPKKAVDETVDRLARAEEKLTEKEKRRAEEAAAAERERQIAQKQEAKRRRKAAKRKDEPVTHPAEDEATSGRGNADRAFDLILRTSGPISNATIADTLGLTKVQSGNATRYLYSLGVIDQVKRGVWQRKHEYSPHDMTFDVVSRNLESIPRELIAPPRATVHTIPSATAAMAAAVTVSEREDMLNETLDLLAPDGFKAKHLPVIDTWKAATRALLDALGES